MINNELIERYVYDVTRRLPKNMREDTGSEIKGLIEDMLAERCGDAVPEKKDAAVVLTELGSPAELAAKYDPDGDKSLIGPKYYSTYRRVLKIVLICAVSGIIIAQFLSILTGEMTGSAWKIGAEFFGGIWNVLLAAFAIVTFIFVIFERKKVDLFANEDILKLPPVPEKKEVISSTECIVGIAFSAILAVVLLFFPQIIIVGAHFGKDGTEFFSLFNKNAFDDIWYLVVIFFSADIVRNIFRLFAGRYNIGVAAVSTVCNAVTMAVTPLIVFHKGVFADAAAWLVKCSNGTASETAVNLLSHIGLIIFAGVYIGCIINTIECWVRAIKFNAKRTA